MVRFLENKPGYELPKVNPKDPKSDEWMCDFFMIQLQLGRSPRNPDLGSSQSLCFSIDWNLESIYSQDLKYFPHDFIRDMEDSCGSCTENQK